jgi:hypothetical protein
VNDPLSMRKPRLRLAWGVIVAEARDPLSRMQCKCFGGHGTRNDAYSQTHSARVQLVLIAAHGI